MFCVKVVATADGRSRFGDTNLEQREASYVQNVPPVLVSQPLPVEGLVVVTVPEDIRSTELHPAPRRQFVIVLDGVFEIETSDGDRRTLSEGGLVLLEDTTGRGHVTRVLKSPASFLALPLAASALRT